MVNKTRREGVAFAVVLLLRIRQNATYTMRIGAILFITLLAGLIIWFEWSQLKANGKKEKIVVFVITGMAYTVALLKMYFPHLPGPTELLEVIYKPLSKLLE